MTCYDFDTLHDRADTASLKWDVAPGELPLWVADMDFQTAPEIIDALQKRVTQGIYGYSLVDDRWRASLRLWWEERHGIVFRTKWFVFCTGVVPALSSIVRKMTDPGEKILIQTPVYNIFFNSLVNNGRTVLESKLIYRDGSYEMDFVDLEENLSDPQTTMMILCNPHNPIGKVWDRAALMRVGELCWKYDVLVVSDEIHCDLTDPGVKYVPFAAASPACALNSITCVAPTKAFNLAGLQSAAVVIPNEQLRRKVERGLNTDEVAEPNVFATLAAEVAFTQGAPWLDELRSYLYENKRVVTAFLEQEVPSVHLVVSQATYLLWLDCHDLDGSSQELAAFIRARTGLILCAGSDYGVAGEGFLRMNIACPRARLEDALARLRDGVEAYRKVAS